MQTNAFSTLPSPAPSVTASLSIDGAQPEGEAGGFAALLRDQGGAAERQSIGQQPFVAEFQVTAAGSALLPVIAETGKNLPPPGKDAAGKAGSDETVADGTALLPVSEFALDIAQLFAAAPLNAEAGKTLPAVVPAAGQDGVVAGTAAAGSTIQIASAARTMAALTLRSGSPLRAPIASQVPVIHTTPEQSATQAGGIAVSIVAPAIDGSPTGAAFAPARPAVMTAVDASIAAVMPETVTAASVAKADAASPASQPAGTPLSSIPTSPAGAAIAANLGSAADNAPGGRGEGKDERPMPKAEPIAAIARASDSAPAPAVTPVATGERALASAAVPAMPAPIAPVLDRAEAIANVVDRLVAARDAGVGALASVAIAHRDFGDIAVNFTTNTNGLEVSLAAEDADKQRALAAALQQAERTAPRDSSSSAPQTAQNAAASAHHERGGDAQRSRDGGQRQAQGETHGEARRGAPQSDAGQADRSPATPGGIYV